MKMLWVIVSVNVKITSRAADAGNARAARHALMRNVQFIGKAQSVIGWSNASVTAKLSSSASLVEHLYAIEI